VEMGESRTPADLSDYISLRLNSWILGVPRCQTFSVVSLCPTRLGALSPNADWLYVRRTVEDGPHQAFYAVNYSPAKHQLLGNVESVVLPVEVSAYCLPAIGAKANGANSPRGAQ
jgi:hypothetical protein